MSSTNKTANYQLSQFVGTDIPSILNDYNGDMRKIDSAVKEVSVAGGNNASDIAELRSTVGAHTTEISGINSTVNSLSGRVVGIEGKIPANASTDNKLITAEDIPAIPSIETLENDVANIKAKIPASASEDNKLVDANSIASIADIIFHNSKQIYYQSSASGKTNEEINNEIYNAIINEFGEAYTPDDDTLHRLVLTIKIPSIGSVFVLRPSTFSVSGNHISQITFETSGALCTGLTTVRLTKLFTTIFNSASASLATLIKLQDDINTNNSPVSFEYQASTIALGDCPMIELSYL